MATLTFQKASWCLQISRTSRTFGVSFTTALPRRSKPKQLLPEDTRHRPAQRHTLNSRSSRHGQARSAFTSTKVYRAQQSQEAAKLQDETTPIIPARDLSTGLNDERIILDEGERQVDWQRSFHGLSKEPFPKEAADILLAPIHANDIEVKPEGIVYLPEIKYRRILNRAFGPGAWGLAPRGKTIVTEKAVTREYALVVLGRLVSLARGEQDYFSAEGIPTAAEGCKSNALMRCCKDLGIASELWDPRYIRKFMAEHVKEAWVEHVVNKKRKKIFMRKEDEARYPFKEVKGFGS
ncbi:hypothetical protein MMC20_002187 [Loxospora ochrophaea]|nr:hypothetical protein [Loxospora ochrophaea]